ncbi:MAG: extracellular solute-binding protein [Ruminococcaceae bacterium]|nr:extracellular solute-binding protein [Oscillospiraceae bacterium]
MKRLLALLIALLMIATFCACGGNGDADPTPVPDDATPTEVAVDLTEGGKFMNDAGANGNAAWKLPAYEFPSNTIVFLNHYEVGQPAVDRFNAFRDIYNMQYETIVVANEAKISKFISLSMSNEAPDILIWGFTPSLVNKGYAGAWDEYIDFSLGIWEDLQNSLANVSMNGHHYFISPSATRHDNLVWVNLDIFEELGVKSPLEYYDEGNWDWNTFRECALATHTDSDGDGMPEIWGFATDQPNAFMLTTGLDFVTFNSDGTATNNVKREEVARGVNFYVDLCVSDGVVYDGGDVKEAFASGNIAMMMGPLWYRGACLDAIHNGKVDIVPWPKDPESDKYYLSETFGQYILGAGAANPQGAAAYMNSLRYNLLNTDAHVESENDERYEKGEETLEMSKRIEAVMFSEDKYPVLETWGSFNVSKFWGEIWFYTRLGEPWATMAEELAPQIDAEIAAVLEN